MAAFMSSRQVYALTQQGQIFFAGKRVVRSLIALSLFATATSLEASFEDVSASARAAGMADAFTVAADDASSLYYNPAGLVHVRRPEVGSNYSRLFLGLTDKSQISRAFLGYAQPLPSGKASVGMGYVSLGLAGLYSEDAVSLAYAQGFKSRWNLGASLKMLRRSFGSDSYTENAINVDSGAGSGGKDPVFSSGHSKTGFSVDLGAQYRISRAYAMGLSLRNVNQPNMALGASTDKAPAIVALGVGRYAGRSVVSVEATSLKFADKQDMRLALGGERWFRNNLGLRTGLAAGSRQFANAAMGGSYRMDGFQVDYAFNYPLTGMSNTAGTHMVSMTFRFGKPAADPLEKRLSEERDARIKAEAELARLRQQLMTLTDKPTAFPPSERVNTAVQDALRDAEKEIERLKSTLQPAPEPEEPVITTPVEEEFLPAVEPAPVVKTAPKPVAAPKPASLAKPAAQPKPARPSLTPGLINQYTTALKAYSAQVQNGAPAAARISTLKDILNKYQKQGIDTSGIASEVKKLEAENAKLANDFQLAVNYYRKILQAGTSNEDRIILLERIVKKYKPLGFDTAALEKELASLTK